MMKKVSKPFISIDRKSIILLAIIFFVAVAGARTDIGDNIITTWVNATFFKGDGGNITQTGVINVKNTAYGAVGNGVTDDSGAIQSALNSATPNDTVYLPVGTYLLNSKLSHNKSIEIKGEGSNRTVLMINFVGGDIISIGDPAFRTYNAKITGLSIYTKVNRTSGWAINLSRAYMGKIEDVIIAEKLPATNVWHWNGIRFGGVDTYYLDNYHVQSRNIGVSVNGVAGQEEAGLYISNGRILSSEKCLLIGGGFGGVTTSDSDILQCYNASAIIDQSLTGTGNREVFFDTGTFFDSSGTGLRLFDGGTPYVQATGLWVASSANSTTAGYPNGTGDGVRVESTFGGYLNWGGSSRSFNNANDGVQIDGGAVQLGESMITDNSGYGINITASLANTRRSGYIYFANNDAGNYNNSNLPAIFDNPIMIGNPVISRPTCSATYRGLIWMTYNGAGDDISICSTDGAQYIWRYLNKT